MAKRLTAAFVLSAKPRRHYDEHGLMLRVLPTGTKQWVWRGTVRGKRVDLGLGGYPYTSLAEARQRAFEYRKLSRAGGDPRASTAAAPTFDDALEEVLAIQRGSWRPGSTSEVQWRASLRTYALPRLGEMWVDQVTTADCPRNWRGNTAPSNPNPRASGLCGWGRGLVAGPGLSGQPLVHGGQCVRQQTASQRELSDERSLLCRCFVERAFEVGSAPVALALRQFCVGSLPPVRVSRSARGPV